MNYTGKQKAKLRSLANAKPIMFQIGQNGLTITVITNILDYLKKHEIGRVSILKNSPDSLEVICTGLAEAGIEVIYTIGRVLLLYKHNPKLKDRIRL